MHDGIEIVTGDVTDMEAWIYARYKGCVAGATLRGTIRGPFCENARTLPAQFMFRCAKTDREVEALVPDPCMWTEELPYLYQIDIEVFDGDDVVADYHGTIGLRRLAPRRPVD